MFCSLVPTSSAPPASPERSLSSGTFIMLVFLGSLAVGFASVFVLYLVLRSEALVWPPPGTPAVPPAMWLATVALLVSSAGQHGAWIGARCGQDWLTRGGLLLAGVFAVLFLALQYSAIRALTADQNDWNKNKFMLVLCILFVMHVAHVIGGLVALGWVLLRALRGDYSRVFHPGVWYSTLYWHFLDGMWLLILAVFTFRP